MDNKEWSTPVTGSDSHISYRWREYFYEERSLGYYGELVDTVTGEELHELDHQVRAKLLARAAQLRRKQLRETLPSNKAQALLELYERSLTGEYMGQGSHNSLLYVQDVAAIFDEPLGDTLEVMAKLIEDRRIGLNGMILTSHEAYERTFEMYREANGHLRLTASDFGYWSCAACGASGDEWDDPADTPCSKASIPSKE